MKKVITHKKFLFTALVTAIFVYGLFSSTGNYKLGDLFFGRIAKIYNVNIAQFFFTEAAYPIIGKASPYSHYQLSRTYFIQGNLRTALYEVNLEIESYPEHAEAYYIRGLTLGYMNREHEAIDDFSKVIEMHPTLWAARNDKAWLQFRIGDIDGALTTIEPIVGTYSGTPWVANTYGVMLLNKGRYTEAVTSFEKGLATINKMTISDWGRAYPGNNPDIYEEGLEQTKDSMAKNLQLAKEKLMKLKKQETDTRTLYTAP